MRVALHLAAALFGSTSWLCVNAVWMELSLVTNVLPEKYALPSYLDVIIQITCAFVLVIALGARRFSSLCVLSTVIFLLLIVGSLAQLALAFLWKETATVFGTEHSLGLFLLLFCVASVNATSNVLFLPYMASFHATCLTAYFVGMGLSALVPSLISLIQGTLQYECVENGTSTVAVFEEARFSVDVYQLIIFGWMCLGTVAFVLLNWCPELLSNVSERQEKLSNNSSESIPSISGNQQMDGQVSTPNETPLYSQTSYRYWILLACLVIVSAEMNSIVMSVQIYSALSYSLVTYHLALTLSSAAQSVACLLPLWVKPASIFTITLLTALTTAICAYIVVIALRSPTPPFKDSQFGGALSVFASVASFSLNSYLRTLITSVIREDLTTGESTRVEQNHAAVERRLFWCGAFMQLGSLIGSLIMFPLVNVAHLFEMAPFC